MKSEYLFSLKNKILAEVHTVEPNEDLSSTYSEEKLSPLTGPVTFGDYKPETFVSVPPPAELDLDSCGEWSDCRWNSYRMKRRLHAFNLLATATNTKVHFLKPMLTPERKLLFHEVLTKLRALTVGVRFKKPGVETGELIYTCDLMLKTEITSALEVIGLRTFQIYKHNESKGKAKAEMNHPLGQVPRWGDPVKFPEFRYYNKNDWEILACTYRFQVEAFLHVMHLWGFDYNTPDALLETDSEDSDDSLDKAEDPEKEKGKSKEGEAEASTSAKTPAPPPKTPAKIKSDVAALLASRLRTGKHHTTGSPLARRKSVEFSNRLTDTPVSRRSSRSRSGNRSNQLKSAFLQQNNPSFAGNDSAWSIPTTLPAYQQRQVSQVYGVLPEEASLVRPQIGTEHFSDLWRTNRFADQSTPLAPQQPTSRFQLPTDNNSNNAPMDPNNPFAPPASDANAQNAESFAASYIPANTEGGGGDGPSDSESDDDDVPAGNPFNPNGNPFGRRGRRPDRGGDRDGDGGGEPPQGGNTTTSAAPSSGRNPFVSVGRNRWINTNEQHFDVKVKPDAVPTWDGDQTTLGSWILKVNEIADRSRSLFVGLGDIAPTRFTGKAERWWYSIPSSYRVLVTQNWDTLKDEVRTFWMNQAWIDKTQERALRARFRQRDFEDESPNDYYIRKYEMIALVYNFTPSQIMSEVLKKAPRIWSTVINPRSYATLTQFQNALKYHEDTLMDLTTKYDPHFSRSSTSSKKTSSFATFTKQPKRRPQYNRNAPANNVNKSKPKSDSPKIVRSYAVGATSLPKPTFPKNDSVVSNGKTPEDFGARGCIYCGSKKHWDRDCEHHEKGAKKVRSYYASLTSDGLHEEAEYESAYQSKDSPDGDQGGANLSDSATSVSEDQDSEDF